MSFEIRDRVVVFDYGEVISYSQSEVDRAKIVALAGVPSGQFWDSYWRDRDSLDRGTLSIPDYWAAMKERLHADWTPARIQELWIADLRSWLSINPDVFDVLAELHDSGVRMAILSNAGFEYGSYFRYSPMAAFFERIFVSAEMGMLKPDAEIYEAVLSELGINAGQMVFIDNKETNVVAARAVGITSHVFLGADELRAFLATLTEV